jgi:hypothetical protein
MSDQFSTYVDRALEGNGAATDNYLLGIMGVRIDAGDISGALTIADYALEHKWVWRRPGNYSIAQCIAEAVVDKAEKSGGGIALSEIQGAERMTMDHPLPAIVRAKLYGCIAVLLYHDGFAAEGKEWFRRAVNLLAE